MRCFVQYYMWCCVQYYMRCCVQYYMWCFVQQLLDFRLCFKAKLIKPSVVSSQYNV